ncbi:MAG: four-carbon acid sugar kinase family protein, partial [candidate division KSB1 bacterium]|nr:four-carbon acid sugar kinase family protein [candidate division KSB1 bacterium]
AASRAGVVIVDTGTRSGSREEAERKVADLAKKQSWGPQSKTRLFKKIDSVLRGHVLAEVQSLLRHSSYHGALLVPANPSSGRTVVNGRYFVDGVPLHETEFAGDPEFPARTAEVKERLGGGAAPVEVLPSSAPIPERGIFVGEAATEAEVRQWAARLPPFFLPVGARDFFSAFLQQMGCKRKPPGVKKMRPAGGILLVSGSAAQSSRAETEKLQQWGFRPLPALPEEADDSAKKAWLQNAARLLQSGRPVLLRLADSPQMSLADAQHSVRFLIGLVALLLRQTEVSELMVEGGSTASYLLRALGWRKLIPVQEMAPGVVRMRHAPNRYVIVKPGSYSWPDMIGEMVRRRAAGPQSAGQSAEKAKRRRERHA